MTDPSQYFRGRTVQEQMNEVIGYVDTRAAEVATDAIASDVAQVHQDMLDADADATAAAASAAAAAGTLANAVKKTGEASQSIAGDVAVAGDLSGGTVTVPTPVNNTDAASKKYVDDGDALKISITDINTYAVGLTGNQNNINGLKTYVKPLEFAPGGWHSTFTSTPSIGNIVLFAQLKYQGAGRYVELELIQSSNTAVCRGEIGIVNATTPSAGWFIRKGFGANNPISAANAIVIVKDTSNNYYLGCRRLVNYGSLVARVIKAYNYGTVLDTPTEYIEWLPSGIDIGNGTGYTLTELSE